MIFSEILAGVYEEGNYASTPAAAVTTRLKRFVNEGQRAILGEPGLQRLGDSDTPLTFASVASQARYILPESVARILKVTDRTDTIALGVMDLDHYRTIQPNPTILSGLPTHVVPAGRAAVAVQPTAADKVYVLSTSASDGASVTAFVEGIRTGGYLATASVAMNGITAAQIGAFTDFIEITDFYLSANAVGTVTLLQTSGVGTELARISVGHKRPRYYELYLWPTPSAVITYYVDYRREIEDLVNDGDEPQLPTDFHYALIAYAVLREKEGKDEPQRVLIAKARYEKVLSRLKYATQTIGGEIPVSGRAAAVGHSRLGAMYPADRWSYS